MKTFIYPKQYLRFFGITPEEKHSPFKMAMQNAYFVTLYVVFILGTFGALILKAKSLDKFTRNSFFCGSALYDSWVYMLMLVTKQQITDICCDMEEFIEESE